MSHSNSGIWGHSSPIGANQYIIFAVGDGLITQKAFMGWCASESISIKPLLGSYKGKTENSFICNYAHLGALLNSGWLSGQESILELAACDARDRRPARLVYLSPDGSYLLPKAEPLGVLQSVSRAEALAQDAWSFDPSTKDYYICIDPDKIKLCPIGLKAAIAEHMIQHDRPLGDNQNTAELLRAYFAARRSI